MPEYSGNPMGSGNPPGQYSKSYLTAKEGSDEHFVASKSYRGGMNVGVNETATEVGNQPKSTKTSSLESFANKEMSI